MCTRTRDLYHEQSEEELVMSLMNNGSSREDAERRVEAEKDRAYWQGQEVVENYFPETGCLP